MDISEKTKKFREERLAREKARLERLREINLKKYHTKNVSQTTYPLQSLPKEPKSASISTCEIKHGAIKKEITNGEFKHGAVRKEITNVNKNIQNNVRINDITKRPLTIPTTKCTQSKDLKTTTGKTAIKTNNVKKSNNIPDLTKDLPVLKVSTTDTAGPNAETKLAPVPKPLTTNVANKKVDLSGSTKSVQPNVLAEITRKVTIPTMKFNATSRKSIAVLHKNTSANPKIARKSMMPTLPENSKSESVFDRLYKPKCVPKKTPSDVEKLKKDPKFLQKVIKNAELIFNKSCNNFTAKANARRSLSAIHFKRLNKNEASNCMHKWASIGEKLDHPNIELNEDDKVKEDKVTSAIKSERKKVKFMTPVPSLNTPRPEELQARLQSWLQKRGKKLDSYHHLQCFGVQSKAEFCTPKNINKALAKDNLDDENKENVALESDSDNGSYQDMMNEPKMPIANVNKIDIYNWRRASIDSDSVGFNESTNLNETTLTSADSGTDVDGLLIGALNDLTALLREGYDWQPSARWLRTIRERYPYAPETAAYWECRAALEDSRGDLPAFVQCCEEAIAKGTEHTVVEANLDQLLDKFMQLKISTESGATRQPDSKLVDVKNVFKSTLIRFAVQQAKLRRESDRFATPVYTVTPVRRSGRLSQGTSRTPALCDSLRHVATLAPQHVFTPNKNIVQTP